MGVRRWGYRAPQVVWVSSIIARMTNTVHERPANAVPEAVTTNRLPSNAISRLPRWWRNNLGQRARMAAKKQQTRGKKISVGTDLGGNRYVSLPHSVRQIRATA